MTQEHRTYYRGHRIILSCEGQIWAFEIEGSIVRSVRECPTGKDSFDLDWEAYKAACELIDKWISGARGPRSPYRIVLTLATDTTETECGNCSFLGDGDYAYLCRAFSKRAVQRLPECVAATLPEESEKR